VLSLVSDEVRLDVDNNASNGLSGLNSQVEVDLKTILTLNPYILVENVQRLFDIDSSGINGSRISEVDKFTIEIIYI
jgi:hypothetical protein